MDMVARNDPKTAIGPRKSVTLDKNQVNDPLSESASKWFNCLD